MSTSTAEPALDGGRLDEGRYAVRDRRAPARARIQVYRVVHTADGAEIRAEYGRSRKGKPVARWSAAGGLVPAPGHDPRHLRLVAGLVAAPRHGRALYARTTGRCARCNRRLTRADSLAFGLGPECRQQRTDAA